MQTAQIGSARLIDMRSLLLLTVLLALIREGEGQKPTVSLRPNFPKVFVGDDVTLICNRENGNKSTKWFYAGKQQPHKDYLMLLTAVTPENNGQYECEQAGTRSHPFNLVVLDLEPFAQLSPAAGGAVMTKGDGRHLVLQADDDLKDWSCFVLRGVSTFALKVDVDEKMNRAVIFAEFKEAERATFWCKKKKDVPRSNAVTLKKTEVRVMLDPPAVPALQGEPVALKCVVWGGPKVDKAIFYKNNNVIKSSSEDTYTISHATQSDNGKYSCHATYSFSHINKQAAWLEGDSDAQELKIIGSDTANLVPILVAAFVIFLGFLIILLVALKRRRGRSPIQDKDKKTGGDYEQIQLKGKDQGVYHTLGESQSKDQAEGGYEPLQKKQEEGVYHTVGPGEGQSEGQGGYEALKNVKAEVYQTLSSEGSKKPTGEAEGGYEQLPQKDKDYEVVKVEENQYEELKKQMGTEKE
ncbi:high affinity immunoglobulin gamma Fc receptor I isoform X6 [Puntigrus tetrazona]|uniref:high affinity immunoglobulin gamma Fc receptor I isoform X6 n=1 Tax=Puntigrus tetrazona TaxID=1606681 RepID=UPI001C897C24|nr:high affinity immunoglobulin gamma Fc receptor I isoform X6 [Puntigrus tetrazona]